MFLLLFYPLSVYHHFGIFFFFCLLYIYCCISYWNFFTLLQASKKIADAKLARDFQTVLKEFQKAQRLAAQRETAYSPFVPKEAVSSE